MEREISAVAERYSRRSPSNRYSMLRPEVWMSSQERQRELIRLLCRRAPRPIPELRLMEVGCGSGSNLLELLQLGFRPSNLMGNELLPERAALARSNLPTEIALHEGDASELSLEPASMDIVYVSLVFSSLLDERFQMKLASRMWQWLKPGGGVLWYDFIYDNPRNPDVRGVPVARIRELFPASELNVSRLTLAPPIARRVTRVNPALYALFNSIPWLRTHVLCWVRKPAEPCLMEP